MTVISIQRIPMTSDPARVIRVKLGGVTVRLHTFWQESGWYLSVDDASGIRLVSGIRLSVGYPVSRQYRIALGLPGDLFLLDSTGKNEEAGRQDLGSRHYLYYAEYS